jgi:hypothetical protein
MPPNEADWPIEDAHANDPAAQNTLLRDHLLNKWGLLDIVSIHRIEKMGTDPRKPADKPAGWVAFHKTG